MLRFGVSLLSLLTREDENFCIELTFTTSLVEDALIFLMRLIGLLISGLMTS